MDLKSLQGNHRTLSVDRITESFIVCEDIHSEEKFNFPIEDFDFMPREGDILIYDQNGLQLDQEATEARKQYINNLFEELFK